MGVSVVHQTINTPAGLINSSVVSTGPVSQATLDAQQAFYEHMLKDVMRSQRHSRIALYILAGCVLLSSVPACWMVKKSKCEKIKTLRQLKGGLESAFHQLSTESQPAHLAAYRACLESIQKKVNSYFLTDFCTLTAQVAELVDTLRLEQIRQLSKQKTDLSQTLQQKDKEVERLTEEVAGVINDELTSELHEQLTENQTLKAQIVAKDAIIAQQAHQITQQAHQITQQTHQITQQAHQIAQQALELNQLTQDVATLRATNTRMIEFLRTRFPNFPVIANAGGQV